MREDGHKHVFSVWLPKDRLHHYRYCLLQGCNEVETKESLA